MSPLKEDDELARREFHKPEQKGRAKQAMSSLLNKDWRSFDEWDDEPIETFQRFSKRK